MPHLHVLCHRSAGEYPRFHVALWVQHLPLQVSIQQDKLVGLKICTQIGMFLPTWTLEELGYLELTSCREPPAGLNRTEFGTGLHSVACSLLLPRQQLLFLDEK